jgi:hypothetical protein
MRTRATHAVSPSSDHGPLTHRPGRRPDPFREKETPADVAHEQIATRAHELYLSRGDGEGDALSDWLTAERELKTAAAVAALTRDKPGADRFH